LEAGPNSAHISWVDLASPAQSLAQASGLAGQNNSTHDACGTVKGLIIIQSKVVNSILFHPEWPKHSIPIQKQNKTEQSSSHFKSWSVSDFSAKFRLERSGFIPHVPFRS